MSSRSYNLAFDNPYNRQIADVLMKYDMSRDTNGEPDLMDYTNSRMTGGSQISHPHMQHIRIREDDMPYTPLPRTRPNMRRRYFEEVQGAGRPPGGVSPYVEPLNPKQLIDHGTFASYPVYNALEMKAVGGSNCICDMVKPVVEKVVGRKVRKGGKKSLGSSVIGDIANIAKDVGTSVMKDLAKEAIKNAFKPGAKPDAKVGGVRSRKKKMTQMKLEPEPEQMFKIAIPDQQHGGMIDNRTDDEKKESGKSLQKSLKKSIKKIVGGKKQVSGTDGRSKRAEIVKKIMNEKGMKMIDASKFVKNNNLYQK